MKGYLEMSPKGTRDQLKAKSGYIGTVELYGKRCDYACPAVLSTITAATQNFGSGPVDPTLAMNCFIAQQAQLRGPSYPKPDRLCYIADGYAFCITDLDLMPHPGRLRFSHLGAANVLYVDMHANLRRPSSMSHTTWNTPFWTGIPSYWTQKVD